MEDRQLQRNSNKIHRLSNIQSSLLSQSIFCSICLIYVSVWSEIFLN